MNKEKITKIIESAKVFVKSTKGKLAIIGTLGVIIGFNLGGATSEQLSAAEQLPKVKVELENIKNKSSELEKANKDLQSKVDEAKPFFEQKEKEKQDEIKRKQEEEKKKEAEQEKKDIEEAKKEESKQKATNKKVRDKIVSTMKQNYKGKAKIDVKEESGVTYLKITTKGFAEAALLLGKDNKDYKFAKRTHEQLSKTISDLASNSGSTEKFAIAIMNDKNTENVLLMFQDGKCTFEFE